VLSRDGVDEDALAGGAHPVEPRRDSLEFRNHRENVPQIEICACGEGKEFDSAAFDSVAKDRARQESDLVAFGEQDARDRRQRVESPAAGIEGMRILM
jgi:hypothetical protein